MQLSSGNTGPSHSLGAPSNPNADSSSNATKHGGVSNHSATNPNSTSISKNNETNTNNVNNNNNSTSTGTTNKKRTTRKKGSSKKKGSTRHGGESSGTLASNQNGNAILEASKIAERELAAMKFTAEAKKRDSTWLGAEVVATPLHQENNKISFINESKVVGAALASNGLSLDADEITPQAYGYLLEYVRRSACEIYNDAVDFCAHRGGDGGVQERDLLAAVDFRSDGDIYITGGDDAEIVNTIPLPPIPRNCYNGIILPPPEHQLTARTFDVISSARYQHMLQNKKKRKVESEPLDKEKGTTTKAAEGQGPSYGATRGPQIDVKIKSNTLETPASTEQTATNTKESSSNG